MARSTAAKSSQSVPRDPLSHTPTSVIAITFAVIAALVLAAYAGAIWNNAFGPEFCSFYTWTHDRGLTTVLKFYGTSLGQPWYRPTSFSLPYWILRHFIDWHNVAGWKFAQTLTLIASAWGIAWITLLLFPGRRVAAILAACYFAVYPGCYSILLQNSAFDFLHIALVCAVVGCYWKARQSEHKARWLTAAVGLYAAALTSKEITVVTPLYLAVISAVGLWREKSDVPFLERVRRESLLLAPFLLLMGAFYLAHVRRMTKYPVDAAYRTEFNLTYIKQNLLKYPLWIVRIFSGTGETQGQTTGHDNLSTHYTGMLLLMLVFSQWMQDVRSQRAFRPLLVLLIAWSAVFAIVPVYSGAFLWHINLAVGGYAMLFGVAVDRFADSTKWPRVLAGAFAGLLVVLGWGSAADTTESGIHAVQYKIGRRTLESAPPVPESKVARGSLIYYEDRFSLGNWSFGGGDNLFKWRYLRPDIREKSVPQMASVPGPLLAGWLSAPSAFFFVHDNEFQWRDVTPIFRKAAVDAIPGYTNELLSQNKNQEVFDLLDPLLRRTDVFAPSLVYYHHAVAAHRLKRLEVALRSFAKVIELEPKYSPAYLNRGYVYAEMGRNADACRDYGKALELDPKNADLVRRAGEACPSRSLK